MVIAVEDIATGTLTSGGTFAANFSTVTVTYPDPERAPVIIDMNDILGVRRNGLEVTLIRKGNRESALKVTSLEDASALETLVRRVVISRQNVLFELEVLRLHDQGYRLRAAAPGMAQMVKPKSFNFALASVLLLLVILPAVIYVFYYLSLKEQTALVVLESSGEVTTYRG